MHRIDRRAFAKEASLAFLSGVTVTVSACGGGGDSNSGPTSTTPPPAGLAETGEISANHGHNATITAAKLMAGGALELDILGTAGHSHIVSLPAQAVQDVRDAKPVAAMSTTTTTATLTAHSHRVTFNAESPDPPTEY